jgi:hypothetical protein
VDGDDALADAVLVLQGGTKRDEWRPVGDWAGELFLGNVRLVQQAKDWFELSGGILGEPVDMAGRYGRVRLEGTAVLGAEKVRLVVRAE